MNNEYHKYVTFMHISRINIMRFTRVYIKVLHERITYHLSLHAHATCLCMVFIKG